MFTDFNKTFHPTTDHKIQRLQTVIRILEKSHKPCGLCKNWKSPYENLPGFVIDYGECKKKMNCFSSRQMNLLKIDCSEYEEDESILTNLHEELRKLKDK